MYSNEVRMHFGHNKYKQPVHCKTIVKKEIAKVPEIRTFTLLHQMTNYVPIPQAYQMTSHTFIPVQKQLLQNNPLDNPLRDIIGEMPQETLTGRMLVHEEQRKQQKEEMQRRIEEYKEQERQ